jgi:ribosomal protein S18 acetylase RimI-like enzyme
VALKRIDFLFSVNRYQQPVVSTVKLQGAAVSPYIPDLIELFSRAFDQDAHFNWLVRQDRQRVPALNRLFKLILTDLLHPGGELFITNDAKGAAIGLPPDTWQLGPITQLRFLTRYASIASWKNLISRGIGLNLLERRHPSVPHYYIQVIAVDPDYQSSGYGDALLKKVLNQCRHNNLPVYLETGQKNNLAYYDRYGFKVCGDTRLPGGLHLWSLLRNPGAAIVET